MFTLVVCWIVCIPLSCFRVKSLWPPQLAYHVSCCVFVYEYENKWQPLDEWMNNWWALALFFSMFFLTTVCICVSHHGEEKGNIVRSQRKHLENNCFLFFFLPLLAFFFLSLSLCYLRSLVHWVTLAVKSQVTLRGLAHSCELADGNWREESGSEANTVKRRRSRRYFVFLRVHCKWPQFTWWWKSCLY